MKRHRILLSSLMFCSTVLAQASDKQIRRQELSSHKSPQDCWMAIDGLVYDMSGYIKLHAQVCEEMKLIDYCGKDASDVWNKAEEKHKRKSLMKLERSKLGKLQD